MANVILVNECRSQPGTLGGVKKFAFSEQQYFV